MRLSIACLLLAVAAISCIPDDVVWTRSKSIDGRWDDSRRLTFSPDSGCLAAKEARTALLTLRYGAYASLSEFPMAVEVESPATGHFLRDTLRVVLDVERGKAKAGVYETTLSLPLGERPEPGWTLTVWPLVGDELTEGLYSLTLSLLKDEK